MGRGAWGVGGAAALLAGCSDQSLDNTIAGPRAAVVAANGSRADALPRTVRPEEQAFADLALAAAFSLPSATSRFERVAWHMTTMTGIKRNTPRLAVTASRTRIAPRRFTEVVARSAP